MRNKLLTGLILCAVLAGSVIPVVVSAQITPGPTGPVDYGPTIATDRAKLFACYSLIRQMIDEHNRQSDIMQSNRAVLGDKFLTYQRDEFIPRLKILLAERNRLIEAIRSYFYTDAQWRELVRSFDPDSDDEIELYETLFGNKAIEEVKPTLATSADLDDLKAIHLTDLVDSKGVDPTEDFTTYTEVDADTDITVTADTISWSYSGAGSIENNVDSYVYDDKTEDYFDGDFTFTYECRYRQNGYGSNRWIGGPTLSNVVNDVWYMFYNTDVLTQMARCHDDGVYFRMTECVAGTPYTDYVLETDALVWYITWERDGTDMYMYMYSDASRETLEHTLSLALHDVEAFQYVYGVVSANTGSQDGTGGYVTLLDLDAGEPGPTAVPFSFGYIIGG